MKFYPPRWWWSHKRRSERRVRNMRRYLEWLELQPIYGPNGWAIQRERFRCEVQLKIWEVRPRESSFNTAGLSLRLRCCG